jgi:hypothetical protein
MKDLEKWIVALIVAKAKALSPSARDLIAGWGQAFDPAPRGCHDLFIDSDLRACSADLKALYLDWCDVHHRLRDLRPIKHVPGESHHFRGRTAAGIEARAQRSSERERQHA